MMSLLGWPVMAPKCICNNNITTTMNCGRFCFWRHQSVMFLFVYEISPELLNGFAPNSHGRHVWSLAQPSLRVRDQCHPGQKRHFSALLAASVRLCVKTSLLHAVNCGRFCFWCHQSVVFCLCMKYLWNRLTHLCQIHTEDEFGPSLGRFCR